MKYETLAAVDLGSNSFHLQIARVIGDQLYPMDSLRESVRLGAGLDKNNVLEADAQVRALETLARFGERLRGMPRGAVRAVGTNALRQAKNAGAFLAQARTALGFPVEVVFGREEARLIYLGVAHSLQPSPERRLVIDIGGGSTEFIIGSGLEPQLTESLSMGSVSYSLRYFPDGRIEDGAMRKAQLAAAGEVESLAAAYRAMGWSEAIASSGTAKAIAAILAANGWCEQGISSYGLKRLKSQILLAGHIDNLEWNAIRPDRIAILPAGVALMSAVFETLELEHIHISESALRQGVLYDLLGRVQHHDMRATTVQHFVRRYHVDSAQEARVARLALALHARFDPEAEEADRQLLQWAAQLHEIGLSVAHAAYHKHSAYILSNADMPGFSKDEQARLARLVLAHRGKLANLEELSVQSGDWLLILCLRLAALFHRRRADIALPPVRCAVDVRTFGIGVNADWLSAHPLTAAALEDEVDEWLGAGFRLELESL
jgi:exopolyphosphatase / guanosine-5'-triphosphate,3'-diphosphate pyrophosphatase